LFSSFKKKLTTRVEEEKEEEGQALNWGGKKERNPNSKVERSL